MVIGVVIRLLTGFIEDLVRDFAIRAEYISHDVWGSACYYACFYLDAWHYRNFVEGFSDLVEYGVFDLFGFLEAIDGKIVESEIF